MAEFIDRQEEMQTLDNEYARKGSSFVVLYGRRRVGKTTLISEFIKIRTLYFFLQQRRLSHRTEECLRKKWLNSLVIRC